MNVMTQLTQFVSHDVINKNTTDLAQLAQLTQLNSVYAVQLGQLSRVSYSTQLDVELSCVAINTPLSSQEFYFLLDRNSSPRRLGLRIKG